MVQQYHNILRYISRKLFHFKYDQHIDKLQAATLIQAEMYNANERDFNLDTQLILYFIGKIFQKQVHRETN